MNIEIINRIDKNIIRIFLFRFDIIDEIMIFFITIETFNILESFFIFKLFAFRFEYILFSRDIRSLIFAKLNHFFIIKFLFLLGFKV